MKGHGVRVGEVVHFVRAGQCLAALVTKVADGIPDLVVVEVAAMQFDERRVFHDSSDHPVDGTWHRLDECKGGAT